MSVKYGGTDYYYVANIQGDIMAILNTSGEAVVEYTYDAWGNIHAVNGTLADTLGEVNPLRYRGYVYDNETEYYYLQSRYYNSEIGRFINADAFASTGCGLLGNNMFAYCNNNPVAFADSSGHAPWPTTVVINDGAYKEYTIDTDNDPKSADLANKYRSSPKPQADGTIYANIKRDGYHVYDPDEAKKKFTAALGLAILIPGIADEIPLLTYAGAYLEYVSFANDMDTLLGIPSNEVIYDRYSITQTWVTKDLVNGRTDFYTQVTYSMVSYYYCIDDGNGVCQWYPCGSSYSFTEQVFPVG